MTRVKLQVRCLTWPGDSGDEVGLQDKQGNLTPGSQLSDSSWVYQCECDISGSRIRGSHVHGPADAEFLYIGVRTPDTSGVWKRRLKISLKSIDRTALALADETELTATVTGQGAATVPLIEPWHSTTGSRIPD